jgi:prevent-host-death family protein
MSHMERIGVRELRRKASAILRRVAAGETVEVTERGRPVAVLLRSMPTGLDRLEREGRLRRA